MTAGPERIHSVGVVPLLRLAIVPAGRMWGLDDSRRALRYGDRWPF